MKALTLTFALLLLCTGAALASTPDGQTPAEETACDNETGAAHGLCTAYCEAMDCDSPNAQASTTACSKVQENFQQITGRALTCEGGGGGGDCSTPPPPGTTCPCVDAFAPEFGALVAEPGVCNDTGTAIFKYDDGSPNTITAGCESPIVGTTCSMLQVDVSKNERTRHIKPEEALACMQLIRDSCP